MMSVVPITEKSCPGSGGGGAKARQSLAWENVGVM